jgi:hypothetical protein
MKMEFVQDFSKSFTVRSLAIASLTSLNVSLGLLSLFYHLRYQFLLLHTAQAGGYWKLLIEQKTGPNSFETILQKQADPQFQPAQIARFSKPNVRKN